MTFDKETSHMVTSRTAAEPNLKERFWMSLKLTDTLLHIGVYTKR
jgi:hypothetical protein